MVERFPQNGFQRRNDFIDPDLVVSSFFQYPKQSQKLSLLWINFGPSGVRALPLAAGINVGGHYNWRFGPSGVRALPLAAGLNVGGHYKCHFFLSLSFSLSFFLSLRAHC